MTVIPTHPYGAASLYGTAPGADVVAKTTVPAGPSAAGKESAAPANPVKVTLSDAAKAALAVDADSRPLATVVASAREAIDALLKEGKAASALKDGRPTIDVSALDRRSLWAVATNRDGKFTIDEQVVATLQMNESRDKSLGGPAATARITGDYADLYRSYLVSLDAAGPEEKASTRWAQDRAAVVKGLDQAISRPGVQPAVEGDPVTAYLKETGGVVASPRTRDISKIASDVRAVLDQQYAQSVKDGKIAGEDGPINFSRFDDRSLAAVALNKGGLFSDHEMVLAASETRMRSGQMISSRYASASESGDASAFGRSLITQYAVMSDEERQATGWTPDLYDRVVALHDMSERLARLFNVGGSVTSESGLLNFI